MSTVDSHPAAGPATQVLATSIVGAPTVQTGTFFYGYGQNPGEWTLNKGTGERLFDAEIKFPVPFTAPPVVMISLTGLDSQGGRNTRVIIASQDVTAYDFEVLVRTWDDSIVYSVYGTWIAIQP
jgi:hypothetical protein